MRKTNICKCVTACILALLLACPLAAIAQQAGNVEWWVPTNQVFRPEEIDQMLAPIALYPDALLAQVLAAATYPRGIVSADRFIKDNPRVPGQVLTDVARDTDWPPSVKAMLLFPDVLAMMNQHLDWTTNLGDAFLNQQRDVMDSVQRLRQMAYEQGRLATTRETVVRYDARTYMIFIEPANSQMVYVPIYDPVVVYGTWRHPDYPPQRYYYPNYSAPSNSLAVSFLAGILVGTASGWGGWDFDWQHHRSNVQVDHYNAFIDRSYANPDRFQIGSAGVRTVAYDTQFRKAAGYRDSATAQRFDGRQASGPTTTEPGASGSRAAQQAQVRPLASTDGAKDVRTERMPTSKPESQDSARTPRPEANPSVTKAGRPAENVNAPNIVAQAAHTAKSEGLKGKGLAEKVHEAIDTRKESKDTLKADAKEKVKKEKEPLEHR